MKRLQIFIAILLALAACKSSTVDPIIINAVSPTITGFSQDTAWTFSQITLYGTNFGYDPRDVPVRFDTAQADVISVADTVMRVIVPEYARSGYVYVTKLKQTGKSEKPIVINYSFNPHGIVDSVPLGGSFSIPGTGLTNHQGPIKILVNGIQYPVDSVFPDRIVSHVVPNGSSGQVQINDDKRGGEAGMLYVARYCVWNSVTLTWDNAVMQDAHERKGYDGGPAHTFDSLWNTSSAVSRVITFNLSSPKFIRTERGLTYDRYPITLIWDTISNTIQYQFEYSDTTNYTKLHTFSSYWYIGYGSASATAPLSVDKDLDLDVKDIRRQVEEDTTDQTGMVNWKETTNSDLHSGSFHISFKK